MNTTQTNQRARPTTEPRHPVARCPETRVKQDKHHNQGDSSECHLEVRRNARLVTCSNYLKSPLPIVLQLQDIVKQAIP